MKLHCAANAVWRSRGKRCQTEYWYGRSRTGVPSVCGQDTILSGLCQVPSEVSDSSATYEAAGSSCAVSSGQVCPARMQVGDFRGDTVGNLTNASTSDHEAYRRRVTIGNLRSLQHAISGSSVPSRPCGAGGERDPAPIWPPSM